MAAPFGWFTWMDVQVNHGCKKFVACLFTSLMKGAKPSVWVQTPAPRISLAPIRLFPPFPPTTNLQYVVAYFSFLLKKVDGIAFTYWRSTTWESGQGLG